VAPKLGFSLHIPPRGCEERKHVETWRVVIWVSQFCLFSQLLFQGTACATAEIVTAGTAGQETPVKSGLEKSINPWWKLEDCFCYQSRQEKCGYINSKQGKIDF